MIEYQDSGVEWLGQIPALWEVKRLKDLFIECKDLSTTGKEDLLSVSEYYGVARRLDVMSDDEFDTRADSLIGYKICRKDDLVINIMLAWKRGLGFSAYDGIVSPAYAVYRGKDLISHYYHYLLRTDLYTTEFKRHSKGIIDSRLRLYSDRFFAIKTIKPPLSEQQAIADYLDEKTSEIDSQVSLIKEKVAVLQKLKQSLINKVVTKGLNPDAELKGCGEDWLGQIPAHWEVKRLKDLTILGSGTTPKSSKEQYYTNGIYPWLNTGDVQNCEIINNENYITDEAIKDYPILKQYPSQTIILAMYGGGTIGNVGIMSYPAYVNQACCTMICNKNLYYKYLFYYLLVMQNNIISTGVGGTQINLNQNKISTYPISLPPLSEQQAIADYLDEKTSEIDEQRSLLNQKAETYNKLKQSLIDEVVTGKRRI